MMEINEVRSQLQKSSKRAGFLSLIGLVVFVGGLIASFYVYKIEVEKLDKQIETKKNDLARLDQYLQEKQQKLEETQKTSAAVLNDFKTADPVAATKAINKITENDPQANQVLLDVTSKSSKPGNVPPPKGSKIAFCPTNDVRIRDNPDDQKSNVIGKLQKGQTIYLMGYSDNYSEWRGKRARWAHIQTETGQQGWVFEPFIIAVDDAKSPPASSPATDNTGLAIPKDPALKNSKE